MKTIITTACILLFLISCSEGFLDKDPTIGLSADKVVDIQSMQALIYGAYGDVRPFIHQPALYSAGMMRDVLNRNRGEYDPFYHHQISTTMTSWMYTAGYKVLASLNTVAVNDLDAMEGTDDQKNAILGDMHFLRALVYFELNNYFTLPSTGYSVPLVLEPLGVDDRVETATSEAVANQVESDIEDARMYFETVSGVSNYLAATALAARIYFYHEKYDLAYERADEVIDSGEFEIEPDVSAPFVPEGTSRENIFTIKYNSADGGGNSPSARIWEAYQASPINGFYSMNPDGSAASLIMDPDDARFNAFYSEDDQFIFVDGKYSTEQMDYIYIRLAEMHLTRAESNIMINGTVSVQDGADVNILRERADASSVLSSIPTVQEAIDLLFDDRTKELAFELGDHFLNTKRLKKDIIRTEQEGGGVKSFAEYSDLLVFPFPEIEVDIHGLTRKK
jgi:hypothetical protein